MPLGLCDNCYMGPLTCCCASIKEAMEHEDDYILAQLEIAARLALEKTKGMSDEELLSLAEEAEQLRRELQAFRFEEDKDEEP